MSTQPEPLLYKMEKAAAQLDVGITKLKELIRSGELHSVRIGRSRRVTRSSLVEYTERLHITQNGGAP